MDNGKRKAIAIVTMLTVAFSLMLYLPAGTAQVPVQDRPTGSYAVVAPKISGLGQELTVILDTAPPPQGPSLYTEAQSLRTDPRAAYWTPAEYEYFYRASAWFGFEVTFTRPDGSKDTFKPVDFSLKNIGIDVPGMSTQMGSITFFYKPNMAGQWSVSYTFPGQKVPTPNGTSIPPYDKTEVTYLPSASNVYTFTVEEEPVNAGLLNGWPWSPLPTGYWERPVSVDNREWYAISGDWSYPNYDYPYGSNYNPYSTAPNTPHIIWKSQNQIGGIMGGDWGSYGYQEYAPSAVIVAGRLCVNDVSGGTFSCRDVRTGELLYRATGSFDLAHSVVPFYQTIAQSQGNEGNPEVRLWGSLGSTTWNVYDPMTGARVRQLTNAPNNHGSSRTIFTQGSNEVYLTQNWGWNTTIPYKWAGEYLIKWDMSLVKSNDWRTGVVWNVSLRREDGLGLGDGRTSDIALHYFAGANVVVAKAHSNENLMMGFDATTGARLYTTIYDGWLDGSSQDHPVHTKGLLLLQDLSKSNFHALDVKTGRELWETPTLGSASENPWLYLARVSCVRDDTMYIGSFDGHVYAIDLNNGNIKFVSEWTGYTGENVYNTIPLGYVTPAAADGKMYFGSTNVYRLMPRTRFQRFYCIDMDTGEFIWTLDAGLEAEAIADGYLVASEMQNGMLYGFGKGKTATSLVLSPKVTALGSSALIEGSVLDLSPAQAGTPAVADEDMAMWMDYLNFQNATALNSPPTPKGVSVKLWTVDPNGNAVDIGTVTSDGTGLFKKGWTPEIEGEYVVYAAFEGSESYWSSQASTALLVSKAPETSTNGPQLPPAAPDNTLLIAGSTVAIIVAIAVVALLLLRKK